MNCKQLFSTSGKKHWLTEKHAIEHEAKMLEGEEIEYVETLFFSLWEGEGENREEEEEEAMESIYAMSEHLTMLYWDLTDPMPLKPTIDPIVQKYYDSQ